MVVTISKKRTRKGCFLVDLAAAETMGLGLSQKFVRN
jgi:hypothetical protein